MTGAANRCAYRCPYCRHRARIRNSLEVTELHRDIFLQCSNSDCGHTWKAQLSFVHSTSVPVEYAASPKFAVVPNRYTRRRQRDGEPPPGVAAA